MIRTTNLTLALLATYSMATPVLAESDTASSLFVKVEEAKVRQSPSFLSPTVTAVHYGDQLQKLSAKDAWYEVSGSGGKRGFLHSSALTPKKIVFAANSRAQTTPDAKDVVAAGKGFNTEVEKQYAAAQRNADYQAVNRIEKYQAKEKDVVVFAREGGLLGKVK